MRREKQIELSNKKINKIINSMLNALYVDSGYYDERHDMLSDKVTWRSYVDTYVEEFINERHVFLKADKISEDSWNKLLDTFREKLRFARPMEHPNYSEYERYWSRGLGSPHNYY